MAKQFDHEMTVSEYLEGIDGSVYEEALVGKDLYWGIDRQGNLKRYPMPEHINCPCIFLPIES